MPKHFLFENTFFKYREYVSIVENIEMIQLFGEARKKITHIPFSLKHLIITFEFYVKFRHFFIANMEHAFLIIIV